MNFLNLVKKKKKKKIAFICSSLDGISYGIEEQIIRTCNSLLLNNYDNKNAKSFFVLLHNLAWEKCDNGLPPIEGSLLEKRLKKILKLS